MIEKRILKGGLFGNKSLDLKPCQAINLVSLKSVTVKLLTYVVCWYLIVLIMHCLQAWERVCYETIIVSTTIETTGTSENGKKLLQT